MRLFCSESPYCDTINYNSWSQLNGSYGEWNWKNAGNAKFNSGDISDLAKAYTKALEYAKGVSAASSTANGNIWKISNSDNKKRTYHAGHYMIKVSYTGAGKNGANWTYYNTSGNYASITVSGKNYSETKSGADISTEDLASVMNEFSGGGTDATDAMRDGQDNVYNTGNDYRNFWGCGFYETGGSLNGTAYVNGYEKGVSKPEHAAAAGAETPYSDTACYNYAKEPESPSNNTLNAAEIRNDGTWTIEVTFYNGYITSVPGGLDTGTGDASTQTFYYNAYDPISLRTSAFQKEGTPSPTYATPSSKLAQHALCGPCCLHKLRTIQDRWRQDIEYDTCTIQEMHVWQIDSAIINGMSEILLTKADDVVTANVQQGQPNIYFNIADHESSEEGRLRYTLATKMNDIVVWSEYQPQGDVSAHYSGGAYTDELKCTQHLKPPDQPFTRNSMLEGDPYKVSRTPWCDGYYIYGGSPYGSEQSDSNPAQKRPTVTVSNKGHLQKWSKGILFTVDSTAALDESECQTGGIRYEKEFTDTDGSKIDRKTYLHGSVYRTAHADSREKTTYSVHPDAKDMKTKEWIRFLYRRGVFCPACDDYECPNMVLNGAIVATDFLLLQTYESDEAVMYATVSAGDHGMSDTGYVRNPESDIDVRIHKSGGKDHSHLGDFYFSDGANETNIVDGNVTYTRYSAANTETIAEIIINKHQFLQKSDKLECKCYLYAYAARVFAEIKLIQDYSDSSIAALTTDIDVLFDSMNLMKDDCRKILIEIIEAYINCINSQESRSNLIKSSLAKYNELYKQHIDMRIENLVFMLQGQLLSFEKKDASTGKKLVLELPDGALENFIRNALDIMNKYVHEYGISMERIDLYDDVVGILMHMTDLFNVPEGIEEINDTETNFVAMFHEIASTFCHTMDCIYGRSFVRSFLSKLQM